MSCCIVFVKATAAFGQDALWFGSSGLNAETGVARMLSSSRLKVNDE